MRAPCSADEPRCQQNSLCFKAIQTESNEAVSDKKFLIKAINSQSTRLNCRMWRRISSGDEIIAEAFNSQKHDKIAINHAEIKAIIAANQKQTSRTLIDATAYCSCEPCVMCLVALSYAKVKRIVFYKTMAEYFPMIRRQTLIHCHLLRH